MHYSLSYPGEELNIAVLPYQLLGVDVVSPLSDMADPKYVKVITVFLPVVD